MPNNLVLLKSVVRLPDFSGIEASQQLAFVLQAVSIAFWIFSVLAVTASKLDVIVNDSLSRFTIWLSLCLKTHFKSGS